MNVNFLNPFVESAYEVLLAEANWQTKRGDLQLDKTAYVTEDVTVVLSLIGEIEGIVLYSFSDQLAIFLAGAILGEEFSEFDNLGQSGIAELGNVITGRASIKLSKNGIQANISTPTLLLGRGAKISTLDVARIKVPLSGSKGVMTIHLALREGQKKGKTTPEIGIPDPPLIHS